MANLADKTIKKAGFQLVIRSGSVSRLVNEKIQSNLPKAGGTYLQAAKDNVSLKDHDLHELREMGHPYALRSIPAHTDDRMVHEQSGKLKASLEMTAGKETERTTGVYLTSDVPYFPYLIYGTSKMRPRRFHEKAFEDVRGKVWKPLVQALSGINYRWKIR